MSTNQKRPQFADQKQKKKKVAHAIYNRNYTVSCILLQIQNFTPLDDLTFDKTKKEMKSDPLHSDAWFVRNNRCLSLCLDII